MREHIRILGILNIIMGGLGALAGCIILLVMGGIATFISSGIQNGNYGEVGDAGVAAPIVATIGLAVAIFLFLLSLPSIIGGWGLLHYRPWSRILMIVISVLNLFHVPLGTALGVYGLWVLFSEDARRILESGGAYRAVPVPAYPGYSRPS